MKCRWMVSAVMAVMATGCQGERPAAPMPAQVPAALQGTWRSEVGFVGLGEHDLIVQVEGWAPRVTTISQVVDAGGSLALVGADGGQLVMAVGRDVRTRTLDGHELMASCAYVDVVMDRQRQRLWNDAQVVWLPRAPAVVEGPRPSGAEAALWKATGALTDARWAEATRELVALGHAGAPARALDDHIAEVARQQELVALDILERIHGPDDPLLRAADRLHDEVERWSTAARGWGGRP